MLPDVCACIPVLSAVSGTNSQVFFGFSCGVCCHSSSMLLLDWQCILLLQFFLSKGENIKLDLEIGICEKCAFVTPTPPGFEFFFM